MNETKEKMKQQMTEATVPKRKPTKCRVYLPGKGQLAIIGPGCQAFDAEFDWNTLTAKGTVEGYEVLVSVHQCNVTFYRDGE